VKGWKSAEIAAGTALRNSVNSSLLLANLTVAKPPTG